MRTTTQPPTCKECRQPVEIDEQLRERLGADWRPPRRCNACRRARRERLQEAQGVVAQVAEQGGYCYVELPSREKIFLHRSKFGTASWPPAIGLAVTVLVDPRERSQRRRARCADQAWLGWSER